VSRKEKKRRECVTTIKLDMIYIEMKMKQQNVMRTNQQKKRKENGKEQEQDRKRRTN